MYQAQDKAREEEKKEVHDNRYRSKSPSRRVQSPPPKKIEGNAEMNDECAVVVV